MLFGGQSIRVSALIACNYSKSSSWLNLGFDSHGLDFCSLSNTQYTCTVLTLARLEKRVEQELKEAIKYVLLTQYHYKSKSNRSRNETIHQL